MFSSSVRKTLIGASVFGITCIIAVIGYRLAGWHTLDAIYMVVITMFGVGYGEVQPVNDPMLKVFTIAIILVGCSSTLFVAGGFVQMITEGEIVRAMGEHRISRGVDSLRNHTIICGFGRIGRILASELDALGVPFVVIERGAERLQEATDHGYLVVMGDAEDEDVLRRAQILHAAKLATVLPDDASNVFITLTARELSDKLEIIARGENPKTERKLLQSGANNVVMPASIGAMKIASLITSD